jgi:hypothetical protein
LKVVCKLEDAKSNISDVHWIGPNILLFLDECNNVFYVEISVELLT